MATEIFSEQLVEIEMGIRKGENPFGDVYPQGDVQNIKNSVPTTYTQCITGRITQIALYTSCRNGKTAYFAPSTSCRSDKTACFAPSTPCRTDRTACFAPSTPCRTDRTACFAPSTSCRTDRTACFALSTPCIRVPKNQKTDSSKQELKNRKTYPLTHRVEDETDKR